MKILHRIQHHVTQSVTHEKENTQQSNANSISQCVVYIGKVRTSLMHLKE